MIESGNSFTKNVMLRCAFLFSTMMLFAYSASAQNGPSLGNLNKNLAAAKEEISRQEKLNYLFMAVGFIFVLAVAWFSTVLAKKRKMEREEIIRRRHLQHSAKHPSSDPYFQSRQHGGVQRARK